MVKALLNSTDIDVNSATMHGMTPLCAASLNRHLDVVRDLLLCPHTDATMVCQGKTALELAKREEQVEIVSLMEDPVELLLSGHNSCPNLRTPRHSK